MSARDLLFGRKPAAAEFHAAPCDCSCDGDPGPLPYPASTPPLAWRPDGPVLDLHVADKRDDARCLLHDVRLRVAAGEVVSLMGASGCGKGSLLRIVAGLDRDYTGGVRLDGLVRHGPSRSVGFVFQEPRLFPWLTVADNVAFEAGGAGHHDERVCALLKEVGLHGFEQALPRQLSAEQSLRVALARALHGAPRVLLLDEPFRAVDAFARMKLQEVLSSLVRRHGVATLVVTHDVDEAIALSDRIVVLEADPGRVREDVAVAAERPRDPAGAGFAELRARVLRALHAAHAI